MVMQFKTEPGSYAKGRRANAEEWNGFSRTFETAPSAQLGFGVPVARGTGDHGCVAYTGSNEFIGVSEAVQILPHPGDYFVQYDTVPVMEWGVIGVDVGGATVAAGEPAGFDTGTGLWVEGDTINPALSGCVFETSGTGIVLLRVRKVA